MGLGIGHWVGGLIIYTEPAIIHTHKERERERERDTIKCKGSGSLRCRGRRDREIKKAMESVK